VSVKPSTPLNPWIKSTALEGQHVILEPLNLEHAEGLKLATRDGELWKLWYTRIPAPDEVDAYIGHALESFDAGYALAFAVRDKESGEILGSTRYCHVDAANQRLEIGYTWYAARAQRTAVNTECKLLLWTQAFDVLNAIDVEFRTHWHNQASRAAIARIGEKYNDVPRNHKHMAKGTYRDTVVFSIINAEWPTVRKSLEFSLARSRG